MSFAVTAGIVGSAVVGGYFANKAAGKQADAAMQGMGLSDRQFQQSRQDMMPWLKTGEAGLNKLSYYLGITPAGKTYDQSGNPINAPSAPAREQFMKTVPGAINYGTQPGWPGYGQRGPSSQAFDQVGYKTAMADYETRKAMLDQIAAPNDPSFGSLLQPFTGEDLQTDPGFQFGMDRGNEALDYAARVSGLGKSGKRMKDAVQWGHDYGEQYFGEAWNRDAAEKDRTFNYLGNVSNTGANMQTQVASLGASNARTMADYLTQGANAKAAGRMATANIFSDAVGTGLNYYQQKQWMDRMYPK